MAAGACALLGATSGCSPSARADAGKLDLVWGDRGNRPGRLQKPRAAAIDQHDRLYIADLTDRIQVFSTDGEFQGHWRLPDFNVDGPTGLTIGNDGNLLVADTHFYRILIFTSQGDLVDSIAGTQGTELGQFGYVRDIVQDADGFYYTCEYGELDRVQVISPDRTFVRQWGGHGHAPGEFLRPEGLALDRHGRLYVADAANHRIQIFETSGKLLDVWGYYGAELGELSYPHDIAFDSRGNLYVCEWGNCRVQKFSPSGKTLGAWGGRGRRPGKLSFPWALAIDRQDRVHVGDSDNHRFQRIVI
jgi:sugar lactone lactonase YvrE